jgi:hypothetical protein
LSARSSRPSTWRRSCSASTLHDRRSLSSRPASSSTWSPTSPEWCASIWCASPVHLVSCPDAPPVGCGPPPLARRRPLDRPPPARADPTSSSIADRRASGFLQVSLSKVPRHPPRATGRASRAEALPMNANDYPRRNWLVGPAYSTTASAMARGRAGAPRRRPAWVTEISSRARSQMSQVVPPAAPPTPGSEWRSSRPPAAWSLRAARSPVRTVWPHRRHARRRRRR